MYTKYLVVGVFLLLLIAIGFGAYSIVTKSERGDVNDRGEALSKDPRNGTYTISGREVTFVDGVAEVSAAPGSASKTVTRYFGNELVKDVNGDGKDDVTFFISEETGGSGTFYYVATAVQTDTGYVGSDALFIGDRIAPQSITSGEGNTVVVNYADRAPGEDMSVPPSVGKSLTVLLNPSTMELGELVTDFEGESNVGGKLKADIFTGTLEQVDTGCFADGECFVVVDGKHVTAIRGWSTDTVGSVQGVDGFGDLENHIGKSVEVYAQELPDGAFTLYGSEGFYIKLLGSSSTSGSGGGVQGIAVGEPNPSAPVPPLMRDEPSSPVGGGGCVVGGCSGQLCGEAREMEDMVTTCEYREEYACYQSATCERQASTGQCGWTMTSALKQCLSDAQGDPSMEVY